MEYTKDQESPDAFHRFTAYATVAAVLERRVWVDQQFFIVYPNLYVVLVSGSAVCRKTIAAKQGVSLLRRMKTPIKLISEDVTKAALFDELSEAGTLKVGSKFVPWSCGTVFAPELGVFIKKDCMMTGMLAQLISLYDCEPWRYGLRGLGTNILTTTCLNLLGCATPSWLRNIVPDEAIGTGLMARLIFVNQEKTKRAGNALPKITPEWTALRDKLVADLSQIQQLYGEFKWSPLAREVYSGWYKQIWSEEVKKASEDLQGYYGRKHVHVIKFAMINSVFRSGDLTIQDEDIKQGVLDLAFIETFFESLYDTLHEGLMGDTCRHIVDKIKGSPDGECDHSKLLTRCHRFAPGEQFQRAMAVLLETGRVQLIVQESNRGPKKRLYRIPR